MISNALHLLLAASLAASMVFEDPLAEVRRAEHALDFERALELSQRAAEDSSTPAPKRAALERTAALAEALERPALAAQTLLRLADATPDRNQALARVLSAARLLERAGDGPGAMALYDRVLDRHRVDVIPPAILQGTHLGRARIWLAAERSEEVRAALEAAKRGEPGGNLELAGETAYLLGILDRDAIGWPVPPERVSTEKQIGFMLRQVLAKFTTARESFEAAARIPSRRWASAALLELARLYRRLVKWLEEIPPPEGITPEQAEIYRDALEQKEYPLVWKAIEAYRALLSMAAELHLIGRIVTEARRELWELESLSLDSEKPWFLMQRVPLWPVPEPPEARALLERARRELAPDGGWVLAWAEATSAFGGLGKPRLAQYIVDQLMPEGHERSVLGPLVASRIGTETSCMVPLNVSMESSGPAALWAVDLLIESGDLQGARRNLEALLETKPGDTALQIDLGVVAYGLGDQKEAERLLGGVRKTDPLAPVARKNLEVLRQDAGR